MQEANEPRTAPLHDPRGLLLYDLRGPLLGGRRTTGKIPLRLSGRSGVCSPRFLHVYLLGAVYYAARAYVTQLRARGLNRYLGFPG